MDILNNHDIYIDVFPTKVQSSKSICTYFLTHLHTDHFEIPKSFCGDIYTTSPSTIVAAFLPNTCSRVYTLKFNTVYKTLYHNIEYEPFRTVHTPFSCGFLFPSLNIVYFGDSRLTYSLLQKVSKQLPCTVLYDGLFENITFQGEENHTLMRTVLYTLPCSAIRCVHYGILSYIRFCLAMK